MAAKGKAAKKRKPRTIDEYLSRLTSEQRDALERIRELAHAAAPGAEETISYDMPALVLDGKGLIWFAASAKHCALYGISSELAADLEGYDTSGRGTLRFKPDKPLPATLVKKIIKSRVARIRSKQTLRA